MTPASDDSARHGGTPVPSPGEARMRTLLDHLSEAVFEADDTGRVRLANAGWQRLTGLVPDEVVGQPLDTFAHPEDRARVAVRLGDLRAGLRPSARCEFRLAAADATRWVELHVHAVHDAGGRVVQMVGSLADTTLRREMEHELRQLANAEQEARADAGEDAGAARDFSPRDVMADAARLLAQKAMAKGIAFTATVSPTVPQRVHGAEAHVRQIITNLASNAVRFTDEGSVSVVLARAPGQREDGRVPLRVEVHDTDRSNSGGNLAELLLAGGSGAARGGLRGSAGLGLAISRRLVERMGGILRAGSEPGVGCVIEVDLPLERAAAQPEPVASPTVTPLPLAETAHAALDLRVLLAEDHPVNQKVAIRTMQQWGVRPDVVADGKAAVEAVARAQYDVVLMDVTMPGMNGLDATLAIREAERASGRHTVILAMTAHTSPGARESCLAAGMDGYVAKPLREEDLYAELRRWAPRGEADRRAA